jgi:hypothetical protein
MIIMTLNKIAFDMPCRMRRIGRRVLIARKEAFVGHEGTRSLTSSIGDREPIAWAGR